MTAPLTKKCLRASTARRGQQPRTWALAISLSFANACTHSSRVELKSARGSSPAGSLEPYVLRGDRPEAHPLAWSWVHCGLSCGSMWVDGDVARTPATTSPAPTWRERRCGTEAAAGALISANTSVEVLVSGDNAGSALVSLSASALAPERQLPLGLPEESLFAAASLGPQHVALSLRNGSLLFLPEMREFPSASATREHRSFRASGLWASSSRLLLAQRAQPGPPVWESVRHDGTDSRVIAQGSVGSCGHPIVGERALALANDAGTLVSLALDQRSAPILIHGNPLERSFCVAGDGDVVAVTGRSQGLPALAIFEAGTWQVLRFPDAPSIAEPLVKRGVILVSLPEAPGVAANGDAVVAAGAVFAVEKLGQNWAISERIVAPEPRRHGHFGFSVDVNADAVFVSHLVPGQIYDAAGAPDGYGYPVVCRVARQRAHH